MYLMLQQFAAKRGDQESLLENMNSKYYYYTRTKGLFRICYPKERPPTGKSIINQEIIILVDSTVKKQEYSSDTFSKYGFRNIRFKMTMIKGPQ
jgi:hypothetical protein